MSEDHAISAPVESGTDEPDSARERSAETWTQGMTRLRRLEAARARSAGYARCSLRCSEEAGTVRTLHVFRIRTRIM